MRAVTCDFGAWETFRSAKVYEYGVRLACKIKRGVEG